MIRFTALAALLALAGCGLFRSSAPAPAPQPRYVVGEAYQVGGVWRYPQASFSADLTGLATVAPEKVGLTANGETFDATALAAGHRTLQLPAILRVTNLENGRQIVVRLNDRGPASPKRLISLTRRAAELLQARDATRVRVQVMEGESRQLASALQGDGPDIGVTAAPQAAIAAESLAPPGGVGQSGRPTVTRAAVATGAGVAPSAIPLRLPEAVNAVYANPGTLAIDCGAFSRIDYANLLAARLANLGARVTTSYTAPRDRAYLVRIGPISSVPEAERMLERAISAGVNDAAIVVE